METEKKMTKSNKGHHAVFEQTRACNIHPTAPQLHTFPSPGKPSGDPWGKLTSTTQVRGVAPVLHFKFIPASKHGMEVAVASVLHCFQPECGISFRWHSGDCVPHTPTSKHLVP